MEETPAATAFTVGVVCALRKERLAVQAALEHQFTAPHPRQAEDSNVYVLGRLHGYLTVLCSLPSDEYGKVSAAHCATDLKRTYVGLKRLFFVGIAGACPDLEKVAHGADLRLGDVVTSSSGVLQYDLGSYRRGRVVPKGHLNMPSAYMRGIVTNLLSRLDMVADRDALLNKLDQSIANIISKLTTEVGEQYRRPAQTTDLLFPTYFEHPENSESCEIDCAAGQQPVQRKERLPANSLRLYAGLIGCGDSVMKDAEF